VVKSIRKAKSSIKIVTGEISDYNYFDLRNAAEEAAERHVDIDVYATGPNKDIVNRLVSHDIRVYISSEDLPEHFMICDYNIVTTSQKDKNRMKRTKIGNRRGSILTDKDDIRKYITEFDRLKAKANKQKITGNDPLIDLLQNTVS
jgi:hypothetical protein